MKTLKNSEYEFTEGNVALSLIIDYERGVYRISEPNQEGVFYGDETNVEDGIIKSRLINEIMLLVVVAFARKENE